MSKVSAMSKVSVELKEATKKQKNPSESFREKEKQRDAAEANRRRAEGKVALAEESELDARAKFMKATMPSKRKKSPTIPR